MSQQNSAESALHESIQIFSTLKLNTDPKQMVVVHVPGSKSIANRILLIAAMGKGKVRLGNFLKSNDTIAMLNVMKKLRLATFEYEDDEETVLIVNGNGGTALTNETGSGENEGTEMHVNNSGTAARFLTSLAVVLSATLQQTMIVTGNEQIKKRPIDSLVDALVNNGCHIEYIGQNGSLPLRVENPVGFPGGHIKLDAQISSQYVSSILMCAPYANEPVTLELVGHIVSRSYIDMTIALMKSFGIQVTQSSENIFHIEKGIYINPPEFMIEPDASTASYPTAVAAIMGRSVTIPYLGKNSLQGDAAFAPTILGKMGCHVIQTETETIVHGPEIGTLKSLGEVDMEPLTDTFLTAAVLAAVAKNGISTITGIANQRVKECNRISAMKTQLEKFDVITEELEDGIKIYGQNITNLKCKGSIHCFDDHRVAMSFSVLGCLVPCIIRDRFCTKKTWPEWWDVLNNVLSIQLAPVNLSKAIPSEEPIMNSNYNSINGSAGIKETGVLLIGMRGAGKTTIGRNIAQALSKPFIDLDEEFERVRGFSANSYITNNGWDAFREQELCLLLDTVNKNPTAIISPGGGIVETREGQAVLQNLASSSSSFLILHLARPIDEIIEEKSFATKICYTEDVNVVWARRFPLYQQLCTKEIHYSNPSSDEVAWKEIENQIKTFIQNCWSQKRMVDELVKSQTTSPSFPIYTIQFDHVQNYSEDSFQSSELNKYNAIELRIGSHQNLNNSVPEIQKTISLIGQSYFELKRVTKLPIILTYTEFGEIVSQFANQLVQSALKWNVEVLCLNESLKLKLNKEIKLDIQNSKTVAGTLYKGSNLDTVLAMAKFNVINNDCEQQSGEEENGSLEIIQIDLGYEQFLIPSTNSELTFKAFNLRLANELSRKQFYLFGSPIFASKSPLLHNTGFQGGGLPYVYQNFETDTVDSNLRQLIKSPAFGGASVTIPLKEKIAKELDGTTTEAKVIGAINTIFVNANGQLIGDNTDFVGMLKAMNPTLEQRKQSKGEEEEWRGLIIGAGGTSRAALFALLAIPTIKFITLLNRSLIKAQKLIDEFRKIRSDVVIEVDSLESLNCCCHDQLHHPHIVISTIPHDAQLACKFSKDLFKNVFVVVEMVYGKETPLLKAVQDYTTANSKGEGDDKMIVVCNGGDVLIEQGLKQFEIWTGLRLPMDEMRHTVMQAFKS